MNAAAATQLAALRRRADDPLAQALVVGLCWGVLAAQPMAFASSATHLLEAWLPEPPALAALLRPLARIASAGAGASLLRFAVAGVVLSMASWLARRGGGALAGLLAPPLLLLWPTSRVALMSVGAESMLTCATLLVVAGAIGLTERPRLGAVAGALGLAGVALSHPLGLLTAPLLAVLLAMVPGAEASGWPRVGLRARPIWLGWLAAVLLAAGLVAMALPGDRAAAFGRATADMLRAPMAATGLGVDGLFGLGPLAGFIARLPPLLGLFAALGIAEALRPAAVERPLALATLAWLTVLVGWGHPTPLPLDTAAMLAPLVVILAAGAFARGLGRGLTAPPRRLDGKPTIASALALAALCGSVALEGALAIRGDERTGVGRLLPLVHDVDADLPARLDQDALDLLALIPGECEVWPGRRDGNALLTTLVRVGLAPADLRAGLQTSDARWLLLRPPAGRQAARWWELGVEVGRVGAWSLRERPAVAPP